MASYMILERHSNLTVAQDAHAILTENLTVKMFLVQLMGQHVV